MIYHSKKDLFALLQQYLPMNPVIVEAGAFTGNDTIAMAQQWPEGIIHVFEPVKSIYDQLYSNTQIYENIYPYNKALGSHDGPSLFWPSLHPKKPNFYTQASSLLPPKERLQWSNISFASPFSVEAITLITWATEQQIETIDLLWLDLQGYELPVMQASKELLKNIAYIYTEVHFVEAYEGQALYPELKSWLEAQGFTLIARDFADEPKWFFGKALFKNEALDRELTGKSFQIF